MLKLLRPANPEDLFVQRYDQLLGWALSLTNHNQEQAEDLVHDAFIQFTHRRGDLAAIENTDAYLNRMLRNMYLSQVRRAGLIQDSRFSIADFDSVEMGLRTFRASDPGEHLDLQDELRQICQYACVRKETSKVGSVLILRFFHGYYPSEIARVLSSTRMAVDRYLQISRREAKSYLSDPAALKFMSENCSANPPAMGYARTMPELLGELRQAIFAAREGDCLSKAELKEYYRGRTSIDGSLLSHVVSCLRCLDTVNRLLSLPLLAERSSDDRLGRDVPPDKSGGGGEGGTGGSIVEPKKKYQRRLKEVMEHRPQELRIAVNGFVLGAQQISSELSKLALTVNVDEAIGFIEVFSEQGVRLLFFDVDQPTTGSIEQSAGVDFDCGRALDLSLSFRGPWPAVNVTYHDPTFDAVESPAGLDAGTLSEAVTDGRDSRRDLTLWTRSRARLRSLLGSLDGKFLLRPGPVTALFTLILVAALAIFYRQPSTPTMSATDLLQRAAVLEDALAANRDQMLHRTLKLEEKSATGVLIARRRIEVWHSAERGITARRLYDERGALVAGDWIKKDAGTRGHGDAETAGSRTIYRSHKLGDKRATEESESRIGNRQLAIGNLEVWQLSPSAKDFASLIGPQGVAQLESRDASYVLSYERKPGNTPGLVRATLMLARADLHVTEMTLLVQSQESEERSVESEGNTQQKANGNRQSAIGNRQWLEYRFTETSFERRPMSAVAPAVFEPEAELVGSDTVPRRHEDTENIAASRRFPFPASVPAATADLEIEVLRLLSQAGADLGEQVSVTRSEEGQLQVQGIVETEERKREILRALDTVRDNPAVRVQIDSVSEALKRQPKSAAQPGPVMVERNESTANAIPVDAELRRFFAAKGLSEEQVTASVRRFANRMVDRSSQVLQHAWALKRLAQRFSPDELRELSPQARATWLSMIRDHARVLQQENAGLRQELRTVFFPTSSDSAEEGIEINSDGELVRAVERLLGICTSNHKLISTAFTISSDPSSALAIRASQFSRSLRSAEKLSATIQGATERLKS